MARLTRQHLTVLRNQAKYQEMVASAILDARDDIDSLQAAQPGIVARVASTANVASKSTLLTIDGVVLVAGDVVLLKNQSTASENGLWVASAGAWTRKKTLNGLDDVIMVGLTVFVSEGTANADTLWALTTNGPLTVGATNLVFAKIPNLAELSSVANAKGASLIGVEDALSLLTAANVESALAELVKYVPVRLADPGTGAAIPVTRSATIGLTMAAPAETNTLASPSFPGQKLVISADVIGGGGTRVITVAAPFNSAGNTVITLQDVNDHVILESMSVFGNSVIWRLVFNSGATLS